MNLTPTTGATEIANAVATGAVGAGQVAHFYRKRIAELNEALGCFLHVDTSRAKGPQEQPGGPLAGVPVAVKDNFCTVDMPTTCASKMLAGYRPPYDATVVERLRKSGAGIIGKTNMDEFAMGSSGEFSAFATARNPWDITRTPGGSSSGAAAAVAAGLVPVAIGSDTGGSVRQPAALCGVVGLKPTYGRLSRFGLVAFASSLDCPGIIARRARDCALVLEATAGLDPKDATSLHAPTWRCATESDALNRGLTIGVAQNFLSAGIDPEVKDRVQGAVALLTRLGAKARNINLAHADYGVATYHILSSAEASSNLARFDGMHYGKRVSGGDLGSTYKKSRAAGLGVEVKRRILLGTFVLCEGYQKAFYRRAQKARALIKADFQRLFDAGVDIVALPTSPYPAFPLGERTQDPLAMYRADSCTLPASLAGLPAISVPCGFSSSGLPIGLQLVGPPLAEGTLLAVADAVERELLCYRELPTPLAQKTSR